MSPAEEGADLPEPVAALLREAVAPGEIRTVRVRTLVDEEAAVSRTQVAHFLGRLAGTATEAAPIDHPEFEVTKASKNSRGRRWTIRRRVTATGDEGGDEQ